MYDQTGTLIKNLIAQGTLNSPWGMAVAPSTRGSFAGAFLVGNFGDGTINAFDHVSGRQLGTLADLNGKSTVISGLWSLNFGSGANNEDTGTLYFTAGIGDGPNNANNLESHGLLGSIQGPPVFTSNQILNGGSLLPGVLAPNAWMMTVKGNELSATTGTWNVTGCTLPTQVNGVSVKVNGANVPVSFASNGQVNFLVPTRTPPGNAQVQVINNGLTSASVQTSVATVCPGFFTFGVPINGKRYLAATHADGTLIAPTVLFKQATPANPGETIVLYGTGFGAVDAQGRLLVNHTIVIDGLAADVAFAGLVGPGLYQFNVTVPSTVDLGVDAFVIALASDGETQPSLFIPIAGS